MQKVTSAGVTTDDMAKKTSGKAARRIGEVAVAQDEADPDAH